MVVYLEKVKELMGSILEASIEIILRSKNANPDALAKLASIKDANLLNAMEFLVESSIKQQPNVMELE